MVAISTPSNGTAPPTVLGSSASKGSSRKRVAKYLFIAILAVVLLTVALEQSNRARNVLSVSSSNNTSTTNLRTSTSPTSTLSSSSSLSSLTSMLSSTLSSLTTTTTTEDENNSVVKYVNEQCRFYMAESAIPNGGVALYNAFDLKEGDPAQPMPDVCIYVADTPKERNAFHTHSWANSKFIGQFEGKNPRGACEGIATLVNHMPSFHNERTSTLVSMHHHTNGGLHRYRDPGAGAITQYYGINSKAARDVQAGSELTIEYGDWDSDPNLDYVIPQRSVEWIKQHGICVDNIKIDTATDPRMGRGAFARYDIPQGTIVAPAPVQIYYNRSSFAQQVPEALFVNYCFQPEGTNMLLFPYGPGVNLINHASGDKANVRVQWSQHYISHSTWLSLPYDQFQQMDYPGAILVEYIALRDITEGEEIFLDYGSDWEEAWRQHVKTWKPYKKIQNYTYVEEIDRTKPFLTVEEQKKKNYPYGPNLHTVCMTDNWNRNEYTTMKWYKPDYEFPHSLIYCNILKRYQNKTTKEWEYTVSLNFHRLKPDAVDDQKYIDTNVPQWAISFADKPYMSDLHLPNAFRHPMGLPADMIPPQWVQDVPTKTQRKKERSKKQN